MGLPQLCLSSMKAIKGMRPPFQTALFRFRAMKEIREVTNGGSASQTAIRFNKNGINQIINLRIINVQQRIVNNRIRRVWSQV